MPDSISIKIPKTISDFSNIKKGITTYIPENSIFLKHLKYAARAVDLPELNHSWKKAYNPSLPGAMMSSLPFPVRSAMSN